MKKIYEYILGFKINSSPENELLNNIEKDLNSNKKNIIFNINPLILINHYKDNKTVSIINAEKYNIPDGIGVVLASKIHRGIIKERIRGIDLFLDICNIAQKNHKRVFLYGSKEGVANKAKNELLKKYPKLVICGIENGYVKENIALEKIIEFKPDILFVALGSPLQEEFIINNKELLSNISIIMPIGGSLDVVSGNIKEAPEFYKKIHLEWLYRMIKEPKRFKELYKLIKFILVVLFRNNCYNKKVKEDL